MRERSLLLNAEPPFGVPLSNLPTADRPVLGSWLREPGSLTRRMRALCGAAFRVEVLGQDWRQPFPGEAQRLRVRVEPRFWRSLPMRGTAAVPVVWGRRALYRIGTQRLLVGEFFLPELFRLEGEMHGFSD